MNQDDLQQRDQFLERPLPHNPDAEAAVLGGIILDNALIGDAIELIKPEDLYVVKHRHWYSAMITLFQNGSEINPILIAEQLRKDGISEQQAGGAGEISKLFYGLPHYTNLTHYAKIIIDKSKLRQAIKLCNKAISTSLEEEDESSVVLETLSKGVFEIAFENTDEGFVEANVLAHQSLQKVHHIQQMGNLVTGLATGLTDFDSLTLGLQPTDVLILAGRPSMGKTALAVQFAIKAAEDGAKVAFFSLEMSKEQISNRILCNMARVNGLRLRGGYINNEEWAALHAAVDKLAGMNLRIDDTPGISTLQIKTKLRRLATQMKGLDLVLVDYLQFMTNSSRSKFTEGRQQEITQISREIKGLAKETNVPFVVLSQLSRAPENRTDHRPILADLRESGSIEQDADEVAFVYRADKYRAHSDPTPKDRLAEIILAKQRNGPTGTATLRFDEATGRFDNLSHQQENILEV